MYTADKARERSNSDLDRRIKEAVDDSTTGKSAYLRIYYEDWFCNSIKEELTKRGFTNIDVPDICLKGDVYFEW